MRFKRALSFFSSSNSNSFTRSYGSIAVQYSGMSNIARACQLEMEELTNKLVEKKETTLIESVNDRLLLINTFHSLKLTDRFSLTLDETEYLCKENKTLDAKDFSEQRLVLNHREILDYCKWYKEELCAHGWKLSLPKNESPDKYILCGISELAKTFVCIFNQGAGGTIDSKRGNFYPAGANYFDNRSEYEHINNGQKMLVQTLRMEADDPILNAAIIHNEFARGHLFDKEFGLLFCRLYMNFALMLAGHAPAVIDSSQKEEYLQLVQPEKLSDPQPLANLLVRNLNETYENFILPDLETAARNYGMDIPFKLGRT